jgi:ATP-binding cassette subfamily C (CFTR/MRP) protein 4
MLDSLIRSPVRYYDENPSGRILNRFTSDAGIMDLTMNYVLSDSIEGSVYLINLLIFIIIMNYWIAIPAAFILVAMAKWT